MSVLGLVDGPTVIGIDNYVTLALSYVIHNRLQRCFRMVEVLFRLIRLHECLLCYGCLLVLYHKVNKLLLSGTNRIAVFLERGDPGEITFLRCANNLGAAIRIEQILLFLLNLLRLLVSSPCLAAIVILSRSFIIEIVQHIADFLVS